MGNSRSNSSWMGLTVILFIFVICLLFPHTLALKGSSEKWKECNAKCGDQKEAFENGDLLCEPDPERRINGAPIYNIFPACVFECFGVTPPEDQGKCMSDYCKSKDLMKRETNNVRFCKEAKGPHITLEECDTLVPAGQAKRYWECN